MMLTSIWLNLTTLGRDVQVITKEHKVGSFG